MLCFLCLTQGRDERAVTYVQGHSLCREHALAQVDQPSEKPAQRPGAMAEVLKAVLTAAARNAPAPGGNGGRHAAAVPDAG